MVVAGPGNFKNLFQKIKRRSRRHQSTPSKDLDITGADGVRALVKTQPSRQLAKDSLRWRCSGSSPKS